MMWRRVSVTVAVFAAMCLPLTGCGFGTTAACGSELVATWRDGRRTFALLHDFGPVTDFVVADSEGTWEIKPVGEPRPLTIIELRQVPSGYKRVEPPSFAATPVAGDSADIYALGVGHKIALGSSRLSDPQREAIVKSLLGAPRRARTDCYSVP